MLPPDGHVHTEWSWDADAGSMVGSCQRAVALGLPAIAFTEHADFTHWDLAPAERAGLPEHLRPRAAVGPFRPPALDLAGYRECVDRCRSRFPQLRILTGVEIGEPHWHPDRVRELLGTGGFDRVLGSLHTVPVGPQLKLVNHRYATRPAVEVVRDYLAELLRMVETGAGFAALAHLDYPIRYWPAAAGPYDPGLLAEEHRAVLRALAGSGRALELNTTLPPSPQVLRWWYEVGGGAVCFGSDAHEPAEVAREFAGAAALAQVYGFRPGRHPYDFWPRAGGPARTTPARTTPARP